MTHERRDDELTDAPTSAPAPTLAANGLGTAKVVFDISLPMPDGYLSAAFQLESLRDSAETARKALQCLEELGWTERRLSAYRDDSLEILVYTFEREHIAERDALEHLEAAEAASSRSIDFDDFEFRT